VRKELRNTLLNLIDAGSQDEPGGQSDSGSQDEPGGQSDAGSRDEPGGQSEAGSQDVPEGQNESGGQNDGIGVATPPGVDVVKVIESRRSVAQFWKSYTEQQAADHSTTDGAESETDPGAGSGAHLNDLALWLNGVDMSDPQAVEEAVNQLNTFLMAQYPPRQLVYTPQAKTNEPYRTTLYDINHAMVYFDRDVNLEIVGFSEESIGRLSLLGQAKQVVISFDSIPEGARFYISVAYDVDQIVLVGDFEGEIVFTGPGKVGTINAEQLSGNPSFQLFDDFLAFVELIRVNGEDDDALFGRRFQIGAQSVRIVLDLTNRFRAGEEYRMPGQDHLALRPQGRCLRIVQHGIQIGLRQVMFAKRELPGLIGQEHVRQPLDEPAEHVFLRTEADVYGAHLAGHRFIQQLISARRSHYIRPSERSSRSI